MRIFLFKMLMLIIIKALLVAYRKSLIILKEIEKLSGKFLRVWAKNQLRFKIFRENFKIYIQKISIENLFFTHFLSDLPRPLSVYTTLENNIIFLQFYRFGGRTPPCGRPCLSKILAKEG